MYIADKKYLSCGGGHIFIINDNNALSGGNNNHGQLGHGNSSEYDGLSKIRFDFNAPIVIGDDKDFGKISSWNNDYISLNISDEDKEDKQILVNEVLDGKVIHNNIVNLPINNFKPKFNTFDFQNVPGGNHTLEIKVIDNQNNIVTKTYKFYRILTFEPILISANNKFSITFIDNKLKTTGLNGYGQLGLGDNSNRNSFAEVLKYTEM